VPHGCGAAMKENDAHHQLRHRMKKEG